MRSPALLRIDEAARYLNVSKTSLRRWTNSGELACHRVGVRALRRFAVSDLDAFLQSGRASDRSALRWGERDAPLRVLDAGARRGIARHVCTHSRDVEESWRLFKPYFLHHAERGAPIFYICDATPPARLKEFVRASGIDSDDLAARGLLELIGPAESYLRAGVFSISGMLSFVEDTIVRLRSLGRRAMLISGEMTWSLHGAPGSAGMISYEQQLNAILERYPDVTIVCHYSMERFGAELTLDALRAHPFVQLPQGIFPGFYAELPPGETARKRGSM